MRVVVTGARGKVGQTAADALHNAGHEVVATDLMRPSFERADPREPHYVQADLTDAGDAFAVIRGADAVVHCAAIPEPTGNPAHVVFRTNMMMTFNCIEAAVRWGVKRFVNVSSETAPGFFFAERPFEPDYLPVDEEHPLRPQDPYALSKVFGEQLMDAAVRRSAIRAITIRPCWVQWEGSIEWNLGPQVRDRTVKTANIHSYIDVYDLADALVAAVESDLEGHEVFYIASPDNVGNNDFVELVRDVYGLELPIHALARRDASGISSAKAERLLGYAPKRSWRDYLDNDGHLLPAARERLAALGTSGPRYSHEEIR
ncbi:MAG: NAD(P)-dependent oxidoreductase [Acidimicrobiaceae bacterium]|nr:NAD(P)-dependent oxidoreductase [Acidimicrobiaceae bacterium]